MKTKTIACFSLNAIFIISLSGCTNLMYSSTRDKQSQAIVAEWKKVDLRSQIEIPRKNRKALLEQQLLTQDNSSSLRRDALIAAVASASEPNQNLAKTFGDLSINSHDSELLGQNVDTTNNAANVLKSRQDRLIKYQNLKKARHLKTDTLQAIELDVSPIFIKLGISLPSCADFEPESEGIKSLKNKVENPDFFDGPELKQNLSGLKDKCDVLNKVENIEREVNQNGPIANSIKALEAEKIAFKQLEAQTAAERKKVNEAIDEQKLAVKDKNELALVAAATKLKTNISLLLAAQDAFSVHFISEKQEEAVDEFLTTITDYSPEKPTVDSNKAALALVLFSDFFVQAKKQLAEGEKVNFVPLVMQKKLAKINQDAATREIESRKLKISLLQQKLDVLYRQAGMFTHVDELITTLPLETLNTITLDALISNSADKNFANNSIPIEQRINIWKALGLYIDAASRLQGEVRKIDYQLIALDNEAQLGYAESNISQWNTLISTNVDQLAAYGASGVKKEQIVTLINSLSLLWIALGVN